MFLKTLGTPNVETYVKLSADSLVRFSVSRSEGVNTTKTQQLQPYEFSLSSSTDSS